MKRFLGAIGPSPAAMRAAFVRYSSVLVGEVARFRVTWNALNWGRAETAPRRTESANKKTVLNRRRKVIS